MALVVWTRVLQDATTMAVTTEIEASMKTCQLLREVEATYVAVWVEEAQTWVVPMVAVENTTASMEAIMVVYVVRTTSTCLLVAVATTKASSEKEVATKGLDMVITIMTDTRAEAAWVEEE